ncbi:MAG TPA: alpha/beta hydrolase [Micromonosporaceae bacterium]|jgi:pimeloyl-ACP methyl ester carboxylesterase
MPTALVDGITTRYEITGDGPPLLMYSPGGFDSRLENWSSFGLYARLGLLSVLSREFTCITFDRRESGCSGGRVEAVGWPQYVAQGKGLLDHLGIERAFLMGGCVGCSSVVAFAVAHPRTVAGMVLYSPAGGPHYRITQQQRFSTHATFVAEQGLGAVTELARESDATFTKDPRVGPWVSVLRHDAAFAGAYAQRDPWSYLEIVTDICRRQFDRDTVPGAEPGELMVLRTPALIVPGDDRSHAPSAAHYLRECLPESQLWDAPVAEQTAETAPNMVRDFLHSLA